MTGERLEALTEGRTDLVFDLLKGGMEPGAAARAGVPLIKWCAYYGDVSVIRYLLEKGAALSLLGSNYGLDAAAFHGHWRLVQFLVELGADVNLAQEDTREAPLHTALCDANSLKSMRVVYVLLHAGADPNCHTTPGIETGGFMRDARTKGDSPLSWASWHPRPGPVLEMLLFDDFWIHPDGTSRNASDHGVGHSGMGYNLIGGPRYEE